ncbi:hypothetical protein RQP46_001979 [Phenoliferia psychrophenolica]
MLSDLSNYSDSLAAPSSPLSSSRSADGKRSWPGDASDLLPSKLRAKRGLGSSSSPAGSSSPFTFANRLDAYDASSSPLPSSLKASTSSSTSYDPSIPLTIPPLVFVTAALPGVNNNNNTTKARSSSHAPAPSPDRLCIPLEAGVRLQFGRKAKKSYLEPTSDKTVPILLPHSAKNASRLHCTVQFSFAPYKGERATVQVRVFGQNGMKIDGKVWDKGSVATLYVDDGQRVELAFWGWSASVVVPGEKRKALIQVVMRETIERRQIRRPAVVLSTTPARSTIKASASSPADSLFDGSDTRDTPAKDVADIFSPAVTKAASSHPPSPAFSALSALSSSPGPEQWMDDEDDADAIKSAAMASRAASLVDSLALDLPGLIASTIVFHPRSTVGVREVVEALLREVGGMWDVVGGKGDEENEKELEEEAIDAWWDIVEAVLQEEPFFGCIANVGLSDAAGNPLPPAYYYLPDADPSKSRVEALEPFVKRVRGARLEGGGKRYFWRRPCLKKNR